MTNRDEILVSARDAEALAAVLGAHRRADPLQPSPADALADLLLDVRFVATAPSDRVALGAAVTYVEEGSGARRTVTLTIPEDADPALGRREGEHELP